MRHEKFLTLIFWFVIFQAKPPKNNLALQLNILKYHSACCNERKSRDFEIRVTSTTTPLPAFLVEPWIFSQSQGKQFPRLLNCFSPGCVYLMGLSRAASSRDLRVLPLRQAPLQATMLLAQKMVGWADRNSGWNNMHKTWDFNYQNVFHLTFFSNDLLKWIQPSWHIYYQWEKQPLPLSLHMIFSFPFFTFSGSLSVLNLSNPPIFSLLLQQIPNLSKNMPRSVGTTWDLTIYMGMNCGVIWHWHSFQTKKWCKGGGGGHCYFKWCTLHQIPFLSF